MPGYFCSPASGTSVTERRFPAAMARAGRSASVGNRAVQSVGALAAAGLLLLCAACVTRPTGDFGRASNSLLHDQVMPAAGSLKREFIDKKPVSTFNQTDEERRMHDRVWHYLTAAHAKDWSFKVSVEFQRTRIGTTDHLFRTDRYYKLISGEAYASSRVRFATMADHISIDLQLLPPVFKAICDVIGIDRRRGIAANGTVGLEPAMRREQADRRAENDEVIAWFSRSVRYRYESYDYAMTRLLVETPHEQAVRVDGLQSQLLGWVERAEQGDYCFDNSRHGGAGDGSIRPRVLIGDQQTYLK